jgi:hypothetical protein
MNGLTFRKATRTDANAMLMLLRSITTEGDTLHSRTVLMAT